MSPFSAWLWKEAREHQAILLATFAAIPVLATLVFFAFGENLEFEQTDLFPAIAVALPFVAVGLDLFSRELRRGTHALVLRTPGALGASLAAKLVVLLLAVGTAVAIEEAVRTVLSASTGLPRTQRWTVVDHLPNGDPVRGWRRVPHDPVQGLPASTLYALWVGLAGVWGTLASTWLSRGLATSFIGAAWLGGLSAPWIYLSSSRPWFWEPFGAGHFPYLAGIVALGLLATAYGWLRGRRFLARSAGAAIRGILVTLSAAAIGYAAAGTAYARWIAVTPDVPELSIDSGFLGTGGQRLFLNVHRGEDWSHSQHSDLKGTPPIPWSVDVSTGAWTPMGDLGEFVGMPREVYRNGAADTLPWVVVSQVSPEWETWHERWHSGRDGSFHLQVGRQDGRSSLLAALRESAEALTPVRDERGRRAWVLFGHLEHEGENLSNSLQPPGPLNRTSLQPFAGGWAVSFPEGSTSVVEATTGRRLRLAVGDREGLMNRVLSPRRGLVLRERRDGDQNGETSREWRLADFEAQTLSPPLPGPTSDATIAVVGWDLVLAGNPRDPERNRFELALWNPTTGTTTPLPLDGEAGPGLLGVWGATLLADGRTLVRVAVDGTVVTPRRSVFRHIRAARSAWVVIDPFRPAARRVSPWTSGWQEPIAFEPSGSFLVIEDSKRVVRFGPGPDDRTVVFPGPAAAGR